MHLKVSGATLHENKDASLFVATKPNEYSLLFPQRQQRFAQTRMEKNLILSYRTSYSIVYYISFTKINSLEIQTSKYTTEKSLCSKR
jgi:hypothetical protein